MTHLGAEESVPGTRTDPEFSAVHDPEWDEPFSTRVVFPAAEAGANPFLTEDWWTARSDELFALGVTVVPGNDAAATTLATTDPASADDTLDPGTMTVVLPPFGVLLDQAWRASGHGAAESSAVGDEDFTAWVREHVLDPAAQRRQDAGEEVPWRYDLALRRLGAAHTGERSLFVWPGAPDALSATELLSAPHFPDLPERPDLSGLVPAVAAVALDVWAQLERADATYRLSLLHRGTDLVNILRRATDPAYAARVDGPTGVELRDLSRLVRARAAEAGWRLMGYADALLWPVTVSGSAALPTGLVAEAAIEVMRRASCVALPPAPDLALWQQRLGELAALRAQVDR